MLLGIVGSVVARLQSVISALVAGSFALEISTGVSVYEADSLEQERIAKPEKAMFENLRWTLIHKSARSITLSASLINISTRPYVMYNSGQPLRTGRSQYSKHGICGVDSHRVALSELFPNSSLIVLMKRDQNLSCFHHENSLNRRSIHSH